MVGSNNLEKLNLRNQPISIQNPVGGGPPPIDNNCGTEKCDLVIVRFKDTGFDPSIVTVKKGQTIQWINESASKMWVASDPHPTHSDYPGFDEKKSISRGENYSFNFMNPGIWGYHNHLSPSMGGKVIVL